MAYALHHILHITYGHYQLSYMNERLQPQIVLFLLVDYLQNMHFKDILWILKKCLQVPERKNLKALNYMPIDMKTFRFGLRKQYVHLFHLLGFKYGPM